ncbi:NB-ARC domains-containing protein [Tanacetum coccineum]
MAELILTALLPVIFEKLTSVAVNKITRSKEIHSELKKWERKLSHIQSFLEDASQKEVTQAAVKQWLNGLQHLAYDIDDILDALATDAMSHEFTNMSEGISSKVRKLIPACCTNFSLSTRMDGKLNSITTRLQELIDEKNNLGLIVKDGGQKSKNRNYQTSLVDAPSIVGREGDKKELLQKLLGDEPSSQNFSIVPIVGMGGIGKTTLARLLYDDQQVKDHFELKAWVCVSDDFDCFNISKVIFQSIGGESKKFADLNLLQAALKNHLTGKRFILVLDDIWSDKLEDWETLAAPFFEVAHGSKIIITTRKRELLRKLGHKCPYDLQKLSHNDAFSLFGRHAGISDFESYPTLRLHGEGIVKKCDGLPLALKALGSLLRTKTDEEDWKQLLNNEIWTLENGGGILPALTLSYYDLSARLKQLFAYCCLIPKDFVFEKDDLILLWMAEGFLHISATQSKSMDAWVWEYFQELLSRSFFQHVPDDESSFAFEELLSLKNVFSYGSMWWEMAGRTFFILVSKGMELSESERVIREGTYHKKVLVGVTYVLWNGVTILMILEMKHLCLSLNEVKVVGTEFLGTGSLVMRYQPTLWRGVMDYLGAVEEVSIWKLGGKEEEDGCNQLTSLRILELRGCENLERCKLPNNIQELSIYYCDSIESVSFPIVGGHKLKSLKIDECEQLLEKELLNPSMPAMLEVVWISSWKNLKSINELTCFIHMKKLEISDCPSIESFPAADLPNLTSLTHLTIVNCENMDVDSFGLWPPKLGFLKIGGLKKPISKLGPQNFPPSLVVLQLFGGSAEEDDVSSGSQLSHMLPSSLTELHLWEFGKLESVSMGLQHLTSLQHLEIVNCRKIQDLPETLLPSLLTLKIRECPDNLKEKIRMGFEISVGGPMSFYNLILYTFQRRRILFVSTLPIILRGNCALPSTTPNAHSRYYARPVICEECDDSRVAHSVPTVMRETQFSLRLEVWRHHSAQSRDFCIGSILSAMVCVYDAVSSASKMRRHNGQSRCTALCVSDRRMLEIGSRRAAFLDD